MKKMLIGLFLLCASTTAFSYKITNSPASINSYIKVWVAKNNLNWKTEIKASHRLYPGKSASWNQKEIEKKLKVKTITMAIHFLPTPPHYRAGDVYYKDVRVPIDANIEVLVLNNFAGATDVGGFVDYSTKKVYNRSGLEKAISLIKEHKPENLPKISRIIKLLEETKTNPQMIKKSLFKNLPQMKEKKQIK